MKEFQGVMREWYANGYRTENLDLFVFNTNSCFFAESKKGNDFLREEQIRFMYLAKQLLHTESKLVYLSETAQAFSSEVLRFEVTIPDNV